MKLHLGLIGIACGALGCAGNATPATEADYDDVAQALTAAVATDNGGGDTGSMYDSASLAVGAGSGDIRLTAAGEFAGNRLGLNYTYKLDCSDAAGQALDRCGEQTDDAVVDLSWTGELSLPSLSATVNRVGQWQIQNLQTGTAEINGASDFDLDAHFDSLFRSASRAYRLSYSAQYAHVMVRIAPKQIVGGSVTYAIDAARTASGPRHEANADFQMDGVLQFAADGTAELTLDGTYHYMIDTRSGTMVKADAILQINGR